MFVSRCPRQLRNSEEKMQEGGTGELQIELQVPCRGALPEKASFSDLCVPLGTVIVEDGLGISMLLKTPPENLLVLGSDSKC